jgi:hypothetical protein
VEPYARRVLVNTATSWWRRRWHGERPTEFLPERAAPDNLEEQLERDVMWKHVKALPARQRAVLVLRFYEDMSEAQTAAMLQISPGTVKSQTSRALGTLRSRLAAEGITGRLPAAQAAAEPAVPKQRAGTVATEPLDLPVGEVTLTAEPTPVAAPVVPSPRREAVRPARVPVGQPGR